MLFYISTSPSRQGSALYCVEVNVFASGFQEKGSYVANSLFWCYMSASVSATLACVSNGVRVPQLSGFNEASRQRRQSLTKSFKKKERKKLNEIIRGAASSVTVQIREEAKITVNLFIFIRKFHSFLMFIPQLPLRLFSSAQCRGSSLAVPLVGHVTLRWGLFWWLAEWFDLNKDFRWWYAEMLLVDVITWSLRIISFVSAD